MAIHIYALSLGSSNGNLELGRLRGHRGQNTTPSARTLSRLTAECQCNSSLGSLGVSALCSMLHLARYRLGGGCWRRESMEKHGFRLWITVVVV